MLGIWRQVVLGQTQLAYSSRIELKVQQWVGRSNICSPIDLDDHKA
ncbi:hypothetical protein ON05_027790 [Acaryochloris sp. CCMEE 5410]|nr:hypothetical protein ON05_027790 [Acaryochloris sp. CCMEE 5410]